MGENLVVPLEVLREVRALGRGAAFSRATPYPLVPLSSADLLVKSPDVYRTTIFAKACY
jgi:hypothetical protein